MLKTPLTFEASTLEGALGAAVREAGPQCLVGEARRVRRGGVLGFFAREHFEVDVQAGATAVASELAEPRDPVDDVLAGLLEEVEFQERAARVHERFEDLLAAASTVQAPIEDLGELPPRSFTALSAGAPVAPMVLGEPAGEPGWDLGVLAALGVPEAVLCHLRPAGLAGDAAWTAALAAAVEAEVPPPVLDQRDGTVAVSGYGGAAAVRLVQAGVAGFAPGWLHVDGARRPATAFELALGIRSCVAR